MIKSITFSNILSYKERTTLDFQVYNKTNITESVYEYSGNEYSKPIYISNFSLIYGKNNSGKSNLLNAITQFFEYILKNDSLEGVPFIKFATQKDKGIDFELELIGKNDVFRYGFILSPRNEILEEWLYARVNGSRIETEIFYRNLNDFKVFQFLKPFKKIAENLKSDKLYLSTLKSFNVPELIEIFHTIGSLKAESIEERIERNLNYEKFDELCKKENSDKLFDFIKNYDVNIKEIQFNKISEIDSETFKNIRNMFDEHQDNGKSIAEIISILEKEYSQDAIKKAFSNSFFEINKMEESSMYTFNATFIDKEKNEEYSLPFNHLSFGTKKIIQLLIDFLFADDGSIILIDEIEHGLHKNLLIHYLDFLVDALKGKRIQFIFTTHEEALLDRNDISSECMILLDKENSTNISYVSDFKIRSSLIKSKRYLSGAFGGVPNLK